MDKTEFNEFKIRFAINGAEGSLGRAAEALGIARDELMEIVVRTPDMLDFVRDVREQHADNSQAFLGESVEAGAPWAIKYALRTLGANRGYGNPRAGNRAPQIENREAGAENKEPAGADLTPRPPLRSGEGEDEPPPRPAVSNCRLSPDDPLVPVLKALEHAKGHVTWAATALRKTRSAVQKLIAGSPALQMALFQQRESLVDHAEWTLHKAVQAKRPWAIIFTLSTLRRDAGYGRQTKRTNSSKQQMLNSQQSPEREFGAQRSNKANSDSGVQNSTPAPAHPPRNEEPGIDLERNGVNSPKLPQPILIGAAAGANGTPAPYDLAGVAAELSGRTSPIANGAPQCARNAPCPCASGRKFKRCCGA